MELTSKLWFFGFLFFLEFLFFGFLFFLEFLLLGFTFCGSDYEFSGTDGTIRKICKPGPIHTHRNDAQTNQRSH